MSAELDEKNQKTFCPLAWMHSFVNQDGSYQLCCTSEEYDNTLRNAAGEKLFIQQGLGPDQVMNSQFMKDIRQQMLKGKWPSVCRRCLLTEQQGGSSRRTIEIMGHAGEIPAMLSSTHADGSIDVKVTSADYRLGNLCNIQCRTCNPRSTRMWIGEWNDIKPKEEQFNDETMESYRNYDWIDSEHLVRDFENKAPTLEHIHFAGGEPLLVPQMSRILEKCIASGNAKNIVVTYNTNMTILPQRVLELWKQFKGIKLLASVDAIGDLNSYIRYPSKWETVDKHLRFIDKHHAEYNIQECLVSTTVGALNVGRLPQLFRYLADFDFVVKIPNLINLHVPYYFASPILPPELKASITQEVQAATAPVVASIPAHFKYLVQNIDSVLHFMNSEDQFAKGHFQKFLKFQRDFDEKRGLNVFDHCPEFRAYSSTPD